MAELAGLVADLVRIDSVNPSLDPSRIGEAPIARHVARWGETRGLEVEWLEPIRGRPSVVLRARGTGAGPTLMLNAHLDTVGTTGMAAPFEPIVSAGRMTGRGAMDMKGSLAACMVTVAEAARSGLRGDVVLTAVADEEHGSLGTEAAVAAVRADAAIVTEPTDLDVHVAHRGFSVFEVGFEGRASHTSRPQDGVNALAHLGRLLAAVEDRDRGLRSAPPHPLLAHGSLQAVLASGGQELFTTPAAATATIERRTIPGESRARAHAEMEDLLAGLVRRDPTVRASLRTLVAREPFETPDGTEIERVLGESIRRATGRPHTRAGAPYWTDAALVADAGIPTVLFGPVGGGIHSPNEWLDLNSLETVRRVLLDTARAFCG